MQSSSDRPSHGLFDPDLRDFAKPGGAYSLGSKVALIRERKSAGGWRKERIYRQSRCRNRGFYELVRELRLPTIQGAQKPLRLAFFGEFQIPQGFD